MCLLQLEGLPPPFFKYKAAQIYTHILKIEIMQKITILYIFIVNVLIYLVTKVQGFLFSFFFFWLTLDRIGLLGRELTFMNAYCLKSDKLKLLFLKKICFFSRILIFLKLFMELQKQIIIID